ncbi:MAG: tetratricopeptide repeat-containing sulfotransferase family protein [Phycisphaerales bacterium JB063]
MARPSPTRQQAHERLQAGDLDGALALYDAAWCGGPADTALGVDYGVVLWRLYRLREASAVFDAVLADPGVAAEEASAIARLYFEAGRFGASAKAMEAVVSRADADASCWVRYAGALERAGRRDAALEAVERALSLEGSSVRAIRLRAHLDRRAGALDQAAQRLEARLHGPADPEDWRLRYELAGVLDRLGRYDQAWAQLVLAKAKLAPQTAGHLEQSRLIRRRQWEATTALTDADLSAWYARSGDLAPSMRLALMAGFPRSGTTLLEQVLASHPEAVGTDESGILGSQFITPLVWQAGSGAAAVSELRGFDDEQLAAGRQTYLDATQAFLDEPIADRLLIEKEPLMTADLVLPLRLLPEACVLMPLRDPRDVLVSYFFTMVPLNWSSAPAGDIREAAQFYADVMRHWRHLRERLPNPWLEPRYEDLAARPEPTARQVAEFLGLGWDDALLDHHQRAEHKAIRTPTYDDITKPITPRAVGRWRHYEAHLAPAFETLGPLIEAFGYPD